MPRPHRPLGSVASVGFLLLAVTLTGCGESGGGDVKPGGDVTPGGDAAGGGSPSASADPTGSSSAAAKESRTSTSGLEAKPPVQAARSWAAAVAQEVNSRSGTHAETRPLTTRRGARTLPQLYAEYYGERFPGPLPFTPLSVRVSGNTARVPACIQSRGWAVDNDNVAPQGTQLTASTFVLKQVRGTWRLDTITGRQESCADVTVKGSTR